MFTYLKTFYIDYGSRRAYDIAIFKGKRPRRGVVFCPHEGRGWMIRQTIKELKGFGAKEITKFEAMILMGRDPIFFWEEIIAQGPQWTKT